MDIGSGYPWVCRICPIYFTVTAVSPVHAMQICTDSAANCCCSRINRRCLRCKYHVTAGGRERWAGCWQRANSGKLRNKHRRMSVACRDLNYAPLILENATLSLRLFWLRKSWYDIKACNIGSLHEIWLGYFNATLSINSQIILPRTPPPPKKNEKKKRKRTKKHKYIVALILRRWTRQGRYFSLFESSRSCSYGLVVYSEREIIRFIALLFK